MTPTTLRVATDSEGMKTFTFTPTEVGRAQREVLSWLRGIAGNVHCLRDEDSTHCSPSELATRLLSHARACGFDLNLLATGSLAQPRFRGSWQWHGRVLDLPLIPDSPDRDDARLLACAALLRDEGCRHRLAQPRELSHAA